MEFPKDQVEMDVILHQAQADADERATMLALFATLAIEDGEKSRAALKALVDDVRNMLDRIESWHEAGWVAAGDVKRVREMVTGLLLGDDGPKLQVQTADDKGVMLGFKSHWAVRIQAYALKEILKRDDGTFWNFIEMKMTDREIGGLLVTLQRQSGETPRDQITRHEARAQMLEGSLVFAKEEIARLKAQLGVVTDVRACNHEVAMVYSHVTGGKVTEPTTPAHEVIAVAEEFLAEARRIVIPGVA